MAEDRGWKPSPPFGFFFSNLSCKNEWRKIMAMFVLPDI